MDNNLKIPTERLQEFSKPLAPVIKGTRKETIPQVEKLIQDLSVRDDISELNLYTVGDVVTQDFMQSRILETYLKISIIDEKTQRKFFQLNLAEHFEEVLELENPAGQISKISWDIIKQALASQKPIAINIVKGEEDLLVLPLVYLIELQPGVKHLVFYGQPPITNSHEPIPEGIVMVDISKDIQQKAKYYIELMEEC